MPKIINKPKPLFLILIAISFVLIFAGYHAAASKSETQVTAQILGCGAKACIECHTISKQDVEEIFTKLSVQHLEILNIQMSPIRGLWEVSIKDNGQSGVIYVDLAKNHLISGRIIPIGAKGDRNEAKGDRRVDISKIPLDDALIMGDKKAPIKVIMFTDPGCPFCAKLHSEMEAVVAKRKDIAFYIKFFPIWKRTEDQIKSIVCSGSLAMLEYAYAGEPVQKPALDSDRGLNCASQISIQSMRELAQSLGINAVPAIIMPDGSIHLGVIPADTLISIIDSVVKSPTSALCCIL